MTRPAPAFRLRSVLAAGHRRLAQVLEAAAGAVEDHVEDDRGDRGEQDARVDQRVIACGSHS